MYILLYMKLCKPNLNKLGENIIKTNKTKQSKQNGLFIRFCEQNITYLAENNIK